MNPEYTHKIYMDDEMDIFVNKHFPGIVAEAYNRLNIIVAKVDFWRYLVLYHYGGVYLDMDSSIQKPLRELIRDTDEAILAPERNWGCYVQWGLIFNKGHPILKRVINIVLNNIATNKYPNDIHRMTGPTAYTQAIESIHQELFGLTLTRAAKHWLWGGAPPPSTTTYNKNEIRYRILEADYGDIMLFKHPYCQYLYINKKSWRTEQLEKPLLN